VGGGALGGSGRKAPPSAIRCGWGGTKFRRSWPGENLRKGSTNRRMRTSLEKKGILGNAGDLGMTKNRFIHMKGESA